MGESVEPTSTEPGTRHYLTGFRSSSGGDCGPPLGPTATGGGGLGSSTAAPPSAPRQRAAAAGVRFIWIYDHFMENKSKNQRKIMIFSLLDHIPGAQKRT